MGPLLVIGGIIAVVLVVIAGLSLRSQRASVIEERLGRYSELNNFANAVAEETPKEKPPTFSERLDMALKDRKFASEWKSQLARADLKLTVTEYIALHIISMVGVALVTFVIISPGNVIATLILGAIGLFLPRFYVSYKQSQRLHTFEQQLADILGLWVNALRSGYSVLQALEAISRESPDPGASEMRRVVQEVQLGIPMEEALSHLLQRMPSDDLDLIVTAVNIQREVGGNLAEILEVIGHTIRERIKLKGDIRVLTSQGRITGYLISGLPIVLAIFLDVINPSYVGKMFEDRLCGWPMLAIGLGMIGLGTAVIQRIVDIDI
ncbi:MAG TPA: type II secretion system F family protein [Aggregatilineales bacterium]|nr:type II secretion system F family protein [Aggregatilineales bacterium]